MQCLSVDATPRYVPLSLPATLSFLVSRVSRPPLHIPTGAVITVGVPVGAAPGQQMQVDVPGTGQILVAVPPGASSVGAPHSTPPPFDPLLLRRP